jgi:hypothetical protein
MSVTVEYGGKADWDEDGPFADQIRRIEGGPDTRLSEAS